MSVGSSHMAAFLIDMNINIMKNFIRIYSIYNTNCNKVASDS